MGAFVNAGSNPVILKNTVFANNTLFSAGSHFSMNGDPNDPNVGSYASGNQFSNNLVLEWRPLVETYNGLEVSAAFHARSPFASSFFFKNNGFYDSSSPADDKVFVVKGTTNTFYDVNGLNALSSIASGNQFCRAAACRRNRRGGVQALGDLALSQRRRPPSSAPAGGSGRRGLLRRAVRLVRSLSRRVSVRFTRAHRCPGQRHAGGADHAGDADPGDGGAPTLRRWNPGSCVGDQA
jgi:hypothetical protein